MSRNSLPRSEPRDPWRHAPVGELEEPLLPRWFVLSVLALIPIAIGVLVAAFVIAGRTEQPVAERRPPPGNGLTSDVGDFALGENEPVPFEARCPELDGIRIAGGELDLRTLRFGLAPLCNFQLDDDTAARLRRFSAAGGVVRFAVFEATGVDSTADLGSDPPHILLNAKFTRMKTPQAISALVAHDVTFLDEDPATADGALAARRAEHAVCQDVLRGLRLSRGCGDAAALLGLPDPLAALRAAGYR